MASTSSDFFCVGVVAEFWAIEEEEGDEAELAIDPKVAVGWQL